MFVFILLLIPAWTKAEKISIRIPELNSYQSLSNDNYSEENRKINPDGYCKRLTFNIMSGCANREIPEVINFSYTFLSINSLLPVSSKFSTGLYAVILFSRSLEFSISLKPKFYTNEINDFSGLFNPDGMLRSFILSPVLGVDKDHMWGLAFYNFHYGFEGGFIFCRFFTFNISTLLNMQKCPDYFKPRFELFIEPVFHIYKTSRHFLNPDGKKGTVTIKPALRFIFGENTLFTMSNEIIIPLSRIISGSILLEAICKERFELPQYEYKIHAGITFFP